MNNKSVITPTVRILSLISLFNIASEMLYPVIPIYLDSIGFSIASIGVLEGVAEATAGLSKGYFGQLSDQRGKRLPFVRIGYLLSVLAKPMMVILSWPWWVFLARTLDRFGKGIRTGARDAMLSDETTPANKGRVFGFYRAADTVAAFAGPALALVYLLYYPTQYKTLFYIAFFPGLAAFFCTFLLKDRTRSTPVESTPISFFSFLSYWKQSPERYRQVASGLLAFALFNSSDVFLLLKANEAGFADNQVIGMYIFYNFIFSIASYPVGVLADRIKLRITFLLGLVLYAIVYIGMAFTESLYGFYGLFMIYGLFAAANEGIAKAWISNIADPADTATALGTYSGFSSICTMLASTITGFVWYTLGSATTFLLAAGVAGAVLIYFIAIGNSISRKTPAPLAGKPV